MIVNRTRAETIKNIWTFETSPILPTPTTDYQAATKKYVDDVADAANVMQDKGAIDCSGNPNYPAANQGHIYRVSVAGKIGGASGLPVYAGDLLHCFTDSSAAGTHAAVGANWHILMVRPTKAAHIADASNTVNSVKTQLNLLFAALENLGLFETS